MLASFPEKTVLTAVAAETALVRFNVYYLNGGLLGSDGTAVGFRRVPSCEFPLDALPNESLLWRLFVSSTYRESWSGTVASCGQDWGKTWTTRVFWNWCSQECPSGIWRA